MSPLLTTENATVGTVIENRRIVELPLNGRNYLSLIALSPNVSAGFAGAGQAGDRQGGSRANQQISISGQRREFNYYTLDGVDNTDVNFNTYIFLPSVDALEEFKVQTGIYSAEFGRAAGQVNVVTKSGSNAFHGTVFEFHRNDKFDARPYAFTAAQAAAPKPDFSGTSSATRPADPWRRTGCSSCRTGKATRTTRRTWSPSPCPRRPCGRATSRPTRASCWDPATCSGHRHRRARACRSPATRFRRTASRRFPRTCSSSIRNRTPRARRTTTSRRRIASSTASSTPSAWTSSRARSRSSWAATAGATTTKCRPALAQNGSKLLNTVHQLMIGNTYTLSPTVLNEVRFGYNSFFNTFGRELAFVRDVVKELGIPGISEGTPRIVGHSGDRHHRLQRLRRQHGRALHEPEQGVRVHRQPVLVPRPALVQGRRAASGSISTTRWATSSRAARSPSTDGPPGR